MGAGAANQPCEDCCVAAAIVWLLETVTRVMLKGERLAGGGDGGGNVVGGWQNCGAVRGLWVRRRCKLNTALCACP